jgi:hypothetical protein
MSTSRAKNTKKKRPISRIANKDSMAVKTLLQYQPFGRMLQDGFVMNNGGEQLSPNIFYGQKSLKAWLKYQQSYEITEDQIEKCYDEFDKCDNLGMVHLPFPAIFITLISRHSTDGQSKNMGFLIFKNDDGYHTTAFLGNETCYFCLNQETFSGIINRHHVVEKDGKVAHYALFAMLFVSIYRKNPEIYSVKEVRLEGESPKIEIGPGENDSENRRITEQLPDSDTPLLGAFDTSSLIPPCDRPEVFMPTSNTHRSPREHWVKEHTRVYWKRIDGKLVPVVKTIKTFKRGKSSQEASKLPETIRIYEQK